MVCGDRIDDHSLFLLGGFFTRETKNSHKFSGSFHQDKRPPWHQPIAWNKTTSSYCLRVIPSHFLAILGSGKSQFLKILVYNNVTEKKVQIYIFKAWY